ncbi:MAG TPA: hypothetical protein ACFYEF_13655 [Candidatus Wunengus sp. YC63]|uniref:hypothetical protein n=1 Tax=unclassified Candidatus Wunengus TaxID=3367695 RepID=UPI0040257CEA
MKKIFYIFIIFTSLIFICNLSYAKSSSYFEIVDNGEQEITFEQITVDAGSIEEQIIVVENTDDKEYSGVIAYAIDSEVPNDYKKMLPSETYVNPNFHIRYEIGYSPSNQEIVIIRRLENRSTVEDWDADEQTLNLEWYLIKNKKLKK